MHSRGKLLGMLCASINSRRNVINCTVFKRNFTIYKSPSPFVRSIHVNRLCFKDDNPKKPKVEEEIAKYIEDIEEEVSKLEEEKGGLVALENDDNNADAEREEYHEELDGESEREKSLINMKIPEFVPEVFALPVKRRPLFPGFYKTVTIADSKLANEFHKAFKKGNRYIGLFLLKDDKDQDYVYNLNDIHKIGVFAQIINMTTIKNEGTTAIVLPHRRIQATEIISTEPISKLKVENVVDEPYDKRNPVLRAISQEIFSNLTEIAKLNPFFREHITHHNVPPSVFDNPAKLADFIAVLSSSEPEELQEVMESVIIEERLRKSLVLLKKELVSAQLQHKISSDVDQSLSKRQREYFLREQLKVIKRELGLETDSKEKLIDAFQERAKQCQMPSGVKTVFDEEISKLSVLEPAGGEFNVTRNYLDWLTLLPWGKKSADVFDLELASKVLDEDHYGLEDVKNRILEFIAVGKLKGSVDGKIICLVGPPGVGKTSIGKSIARSLGREYYRFSVGGLSDVAEIKGHRRTYIGAMPGKIIQAFKTVKTENPLVMIDEIDKIGRGHNGDPASALLEMLDPEQNSSFLDHYLDVPIDLSKVLFVCTANVLDTIPGPLLDRMEIINLAGYVTQEKVEIAKRYLIPQTLSATGVDSAAAEFKDSAIEALIKQYCRESGVRNLKKSIEKLYRKLALKFVKKECDKYVITSENLKDFVGQPPFGDEKLFARPIPGVSVGLAWTSMGGSILYFESVLDHALNSPQSKPSFTRTGQMGKVMEESSSIAYTFAKSFFANMTPPNDFFEKASIHLHVPEGATPKDGPSAGCTMVTSLLSLALNRAIPCDIAMTGELTLTGKILKIGGVKEKAIAAKRSGITRVLFPKSNMADWHELPPFIKEGLQPHFVEDYSEIFSICFPSQ